MGNFASVAFPIRAQQRHEDEEKVCFQVLNHTAWIWPIWEKQSHCEALLG